MNITIHIRLYQFCMSMKGSLGVKSGMSQHVCNIVSLHWTEDISRQRQGLDMDLQHH